MTSIVAAVEKETTEISYCVVPVIGISVLMADDKPLTIVFQLFGLLKLMLPDLSKMKPSCTTSALAVMGAIATTAAEMAPSASLRMLMFIDS